MSGETVLTIVGNVVNDPELRFTASGAAVAKFRIASTPRTFDRQTNEWKDGETLFLAVNCWRQLGENVAESVHKGMRVVVQGRLVQRSWEKDGEPRTAMEIDAEEVAPSLRNATAKVTKAPRQGQTNRHDGSPTQPGTQDPWASNAPRQAPQAGSWGTPGDASPPF